jgi:peptide/nickel transport system substrate-binding protein
MMFPNTRTGRALSDLNVRKAVDVILDRKALRQALSGGSETRSLFPTASPYHKTDDAGTLEEDQSMAETLLDNAGWVLENGKRKKNGVELTLELYSYPFRPDLGTMRPLIQASLESVGITVTGSDVCLWGSEDQAVQDILGQNDFDLLMWAQHTLPNGDPQWFLNAFFRGDPMDSRNYAGINSATIDSLLDALALAGHANSARVNAAMAVHTEILDEYVVSNLVTPEWHVGLSSKLADYDPWGSDYYVIRADLTAVTTTTTTAGNRGTASGASRGAVLGGLLAVCLLPLAAA